MRVCPPEIADHSSHRAGSVAALKLLKLLVFVDVKRTGAAIILQFTLVCVLFVTFTNDDVMPGIPEEECPFPFSHSPLVLLIL